MSYLEKIISALSGTMVTPTPYGWFHLIFLALMVISTVVVSLAFKNKSDKTIKLVILTYVIICFILETYKQLLFSYNATTNQWAYQWYAFPFQFCSTPMYVALFAVMLKKGKLQESLYSFLATFGLLAGFLVMLFPLDIFTSQIGISIQTMIHHGGQVFIGAFLIITNKVKLDLKTPLRALPTFIALVTIALLMNITLINFTNGQDFNMFFISPHFPSTLPVFSIIYNKFPYILFLFSYILGFTIGAYLVVFSTIGIKRLPARIKNNNILANN